MGFSTATRYISLADDVSARVGLLALGSLSTLAQRWRLLRSITRRLHWSLGVRPSLVHGLKVHLDPCDDSQVLIFDEVFVRGGYRLDDVPFVPDLVVDCGAHIGLFSLLAKHRFPDARLVAFEPNPANITMLNRQVRRNRLHVETVRAAVWTHDGTGSFEANSSCDGHLLADADSSAKASVALVDLSRYLPLERSTKLILKMDIEGGEDILLPFVLPRLPRACAIFFETHSGEVGWAEHEQRLQAHGFSVTRHNARGLYSDGFALRVG